MQSEPASHIIPFSHLSQLPPQSTSVSSWFRMPSSQAVTITGGVFEMVEVSSNAPGLGGGAGIALAYTIGTSKINTNSSIIPLLCILLNFCFWVL